MYIVDKRPLEQTIKVVDSVEHKQRRLDKMITTNTEYKRKKNTHD